MAADLPVKAPMTPAAVVADSWSGGYVGIQGGYGWGRGRKTDNTGFDTGNYNISGALVGGTLGYNMQHGPIVWGLETDLAYAWIGGSTNGTGAGFPGCAGFYCDSKIRALGTFRGRVGYAHGNVLPFVSGGLAYGNVRASERLPIGGASGSKWVLGWTAGAGVEGKVMPGWSVKVEYLYVDLGKHDIFTNAFLGPQQVQTRAHVARVGINRSFNGPLGIP